MDHSPTVPTIESSAAIHSRLLDAYPSHSAYIATTHCGESAITITNLCSKHPSPSQFIDTGLEISAIVLTGNVLLVRGLNTVVAWLLTEGGVVDGTFGERRVDRSDSLWDMQTPSDGHGAVEMLIFWVKGEIATIGWHGDPFRIYHIKTGEILNLDGADLSCRYYYFDRLCYANPNMHHYDSYEPHEPPECRWRVSGTTSVEGWAKDSEGKHRLWLHPRWRSRWNRMNWLDPVTTLRFSTPSELVVVKF